MANAPATKVFVPSDTSARSLGADRVADAIAAEARKRGTPVEIVRNGSRGLYWLEPMVEVQTASGRLAYGPVGAADAAGVLDAALASSHEHPLHLGNPDDIPFLKRQTRLTFARCGVVDPASLADYRAHDGYSGLARALRMAPAAVVEEVTQSGLRGRGGAGFPTGI